MKIRTLIVDDMPLARRRLRECLANDPDLEVVGECVNGGEAVAAIAAQSPDLVFLDVQMPQVGGFDVIEAVGAAAMPAVVFVTAYDEFAIRAFEVNALDYLLKPFEEARLATAVERAKRQIARRGGPRGCSSRGRTPSRPSRRRTCKCVEHHVTADVATGRFIQFRWFRSTLVRIRVRRLPLPTAPT